MYVHSFSSLLAVNRRLDEWVSTNRVDFEHTMEDEKDRDILPDGVFSFQNLSFSI